MFTIRNLGGVALLLQGSTFLWLTPEFASRGVPTSGALWSATRIGALAMVLAFTVATWGLFQRAPWWETVAIGAAAAGLALLVLYWLAAHRAGEATPWFTAMAVGLGSVGVLVLLLVPALERWVDAHVMAG